jgi:hypothetical protein
MVLGRDSPGKVVTTPKDYISLIQEFEHTVLQKVVDMDRP